MLVSLLVPLACKPDQGLTRIPEPPVVDITAPTEGAVFRQGDGTITIVATVADNVDTPDTLALTWVMGDQEIPAQADAGGAVVLELDPSLMELGGQSITLNALDSDGQLGWDSADFQIGGPLGTPLVLITAPEDGSSFAPGETIAFQGEASDTTTPASDLTFTWKSDLDGTLLGAISSAGQSVLVSSSLSTGTHQVTLSATDTDGETGSDSITVTVAEDTTGGDTGEPVVDVEPGDLILSELMVDPSVVDDTQGEWFELYNTASYPVEIQGYTLRDDDYDSWVISESMVVPPHDYFLVCANTDPATNGGVRGCDAWFLRAELPPPGMALGNNGDEVILERPDGTEIDRLVYSAEWVQTAVAVGVDPAHLDAVGNDDFANWCPQTTVMTTGGEPGTPGVENDSCR